LNKNKIKGLKDLQSHALPDDDDAINSLKTIATEAAARQLRQSNEMIYSKVVRFSSSLS